MKNLILFIAAFASTALAKNSNLKLDRSVAQEMVPVIYYISYDRATGTKVDNRTSEQASADSWASFTPGHRLDFLEKLYYSEARAKSDSGLRHATCFTGEAEQVKKFLGSFQVDRTNEKPSVTTSDDGAMISIKFSADKKDFFYRVSSCSQMGKSGAYQVSRVDFNKNNRFPASSDTETVEDSSTEGFKINDKVPTGSHLFVLKTDYGNAKPEANRPWKGMRVDNSEDALTFALVLQGYFYEGMANQNSDPEQNFIAQNNSKHYWCHMPWLNQGSNGREALHGLTNERGLQPSEKIYPKTTPGSDWGIGFYNGNGCQTLGKIFANASKPNFNNVSFPDGTVSAKILFTTAPDGSAFKDLDGAFAWKAHVSPPNSTARSIQDVRHLQMDISVKDSTLGGINHSLDNWLMLTYYYDAKYTPPKTLPEPLKSIWSNLPDGLKHMRPMGVQLGFDNGESTIFEGANTNQVSGNLNGPADNPKSSCLGCHGVAGTNKAMAPGFTKDSDFQPFKGKTLDFSQQLALAKRNFETKQ